MTQCSVTTAWNGEPCKNPSWSGSAEGRCWVHAPEGQEKRRAASRKMAARKAATVAARRRYKDVVLTGPPPSIPLVVAPTGLYARLKGLIAEAERAAAMLPHLRSALAALGNE